MAEGEERFDLAVIGGGPGGYVCAIRAAQLGLKVACIDKDATLGGTCLNVGCIPSKALLESSERFEAAQHGLAAHGVRLEGTLSLDLATMMARKEQIVAQLTTGVAGLLRKNGVRWVKGRARIVDGETLVVDGPKDRTFKADAIVIATGSESAPLPGVAVDGDRIGTSTEALSWTAVPAHLVLIGAGVIGLELGSVWRRLGAKVTVLEYLDRILPGIDGEAAREAKKLLAKQGLDFHLGARVTGAQIAGEAVTVRWQDAAGEEHEVVGDRVLVAVGRRPYTEGLGCEEAGIARDSRGRIVVDDAYRTSLAGVFAIGDVIAGPMLAHKAADEGIAVAELIAGGDGHVNYDAIPSIVYTHPEVASVGQSEEQLKADGVTYRKGRFRYGGNGRAMALGEGDGFVKVLADAKTDRILGCHIVGARAGDLIAEMALAVEFSASAEDLARSVHAHPTLAEIIREAALDVAKRALHK